LKAWLIWSWAAASYLAQYPRSIYRGMWLVVENIAPNLWPNPKLALVSLATLAAHEIR